MSEPLLMEVRAWAAQDAATNALLGDGSSGHYVGRAPRAARRPYLLYDLIDEDGHHHFGGVSRIGNPTVEVEAWADTVRDALRVADAVRARLDGARVTMGAASVRGVFFRGRRRIEEVPTDGTDDVRQGIVQDFDVWHARP